MNTNADPDGLVRQGNERVLRARFNDARFFWDTDQKKKLEDRLEDLKNVTFQAKLGSYLREDPARRRTGEAAGRRTHAARRCCRKCDLTTDMVKEFTDLQGIVGGLYARAQGEPEEVWQAIYDHYKPLSMEDSIPATHAGRIVALADKLDTLRECFEVGLTPTGSRIRSRCAARRRASCESSWKASRNSLPTGMADELPSSCATASNTTSATSAASPTTKSAPAWPPAGTICSIWKRACKRVQAVRPTPDFEPLAASFKRIKNILKQAEFQAARQHSTPQLARSRARNRTCTSEYPAHRRASRSNRASARCGPKSICSSIRCWSMRPTPNIRRNRLDAAA